MHTIAVRLMSFILLFSFVKKSENGFSAPVRLQSRGFLHPAGALPQLRHQISQA